MDREPTATGGNGAKARTVAQEAGLWRRPLVEHWPPVAISPDARDITTGGDLEGCVAYIDPTYVDQPGADGKLRKTTDYQFNLKRADVLVLAKRWHDAGATVCISEAEPIEGLGPGWFDTEITANRRGQKRTWSTQQREFLTMNRPPAHRVAVQTTMFPRST